MPENITDFTLVAGHWVAMTRDADGANDCSPVKILNVESGDGKLSVYFYEAFYPEGVREKEYVLRHIRRDLLHLEGKDAEGKFVIFTELTREWLASHFNLSEIYALFSPEGPAAVLEKHHFPHKT